MAFQPGHPKLGGRKPGTPNKAKTCVRTIVEAALGKTIPEALLELTSGERDKKERIRILESLLPYTYPKLQTVELRPDDIHENIEALDELKHAYEDIKQLLEIKKEIENE